MDEKKKLHMEIIAIVAIAVLIIAVSVAFVYSDFSDKKLQKDFVNKTVKSSAQKADKIRSESDISVVGTYIKGDGNMNFGEMTLTGDRKVITDTAEEEGWWTSKEKDGFTFVSIGFPSDTSPMIYQVYNEYLVSVSAGIYFGDVKMEKAFNSEFVSADKNMTITVNKSGKAKGKYVSPSSDANEIPISYSGSYSVENDIMKIILNGDETDFLMFDFKVDNSPISKGISAIYFKKQDES